MTVDDDPTGDIVSAATIARQIRRGEMTAADVIERHLSLVEEVNPHLNALVAERPNAARAEARSVDRHVLAQRGSGLLAGVAFTAKDVLATVDLPTTAGSRLLRDNRYRHDATVVARMRQAGAVLVGKSNCPEFAFGVDTTNDLFGRTTNPLGSFTVGGSSGGEAAAVAAGMSVIGLGTDFGGSVRWPAQCTGLYGLRPTVGRVPGTGQIPGFPGQDPVVVNGASFQGRIQVPGILAASLDSVELALSVVSGADGLDPCCATDPFVRSRHAVDWADVDVAFGVLAHPATASEPSAAVAYAAELLGRAGAFVRSGLPGAMEHAPELYSTLRTMEPLSEIVELGIGRTGDLTTFVQELIDAAPQPPGRRFDDGWADRDRLRAELLTWLRGSRLLILPVATGLPFDVDRSSPDRGRPQGGMDLLTPSRAVSLFGVPALSVPVGRTRQGRPLSVQVVGPPYREDLVLAAGLCIEAGKQPEWTT